MFSNRTQDGGEQGEFAASQKRAFISMAYCFSLLIGAYTIFDPLIFGGLHVAVIFGAIATVSFAACGAWAHVSGRVGGPVTALVIAAIACETGALLLHGGLDGYLAPFIVCIPLVAATFLPLSKAISASLVTIAIAVIVLGLDIGGLVADPVYDIERLTIAAGIVVICAILFTLICTMTIMSHIRYTTQNLERNRALLSAFSHDAPVAIAMFDRNLRYLEVSERWLSDYALTRADVIGRTHYEVFPEIPQSWKDVHARCLKGATEHSKGDRFERLDGTVYWLTWEVRPWYDKRGQIGGIVMSTRDISEDMARHEAMEKASAEARRASEMKSVFLANLSHEIRTPLNGVLGLAGSLATDDLPAEARQKAQTIEQAGRLMLTLLNDVLDLSKIEAEKMELAPEPVAPMAMIETITELFRPGATQKGIALVTTSGNMPDGLCLDPTRVKQCLSNLLSNAVKFTEEGSIRVHADYHPETDAAGRLTIDVSDTGIGIAPDKRDRLFSDFTQADESIAGQYGGTGLGLALTRRLARLMGGDVTILTSSMAGTTFRLQIAARTAAPSDIKQAVTSLRADLSWLREARILIADDVATNRTVAELFLKEHGAVVLHAANGLEALDLLEEEMVDLVLLDLNMPVLDGPETLRRIRSRTGLWATLPVVGLTGSTDEGDRSKYLSLGLSDYVVKPIDKAEFLPVVATCLRDAARLRALEEETGTQGASENTISA